MAELTPMMQQYINIKEENKGSILFFRLGDFYEMFFDDAVLVSRELELTLTGRECGLETKAPMCGVPYHAAENYILKLIKKGYKVAICEQVEDPQLAKGLVKREITRVVTPGTVTESLMLDEKKNNYIVSIYKLSMYYGFAIADVTTGELMCTEFGGSNANMILMDELARLNPSEIVTNRAFFEISADVENIKNRFNTYISCLEDEIYDNKKAIEIIKNKVKLFDQTPNKNECAYIATGALIEYLESIQKTNLEHINKLGVYNVDKFMTIDLSSRRNLEITETMREKAKKGTLLWVMDKTSTAMGGRMLRSWVDRPLIDVDKINERLEAIETFKGSPILMADIIEKLNKIYDIERIIGKIVYGSANARDMIALKLSLLELPNLKYILSDIKDPLIVKLVENLELVTDVADLIEKAIVDEPPISTKEGGIIKSGYNTEVDELRGAGVHGKEWLASLELRERERTGIKNLKISFNKVFGYYIEVTKSNLSMVPSDYIRKQTLTGSERYIIEELKVMEEKILGAEEKVIILEYELFCEIRAYISSQIEKLQKTAFVIANLDAIISLARIAEENNYVKPIVDNGENIEIKEGRHPVVEKMMNEGNFISNDTMLNLDTDIINIITGPNMAGKSTYMRQVALITLMAQIGSFVPAAFAHIGIVDRIFTRVGASDDLAMGQSTFMVEMVEVANILNNATQKSLVILDEIGRGTSTFDGLSIAWSVIEHISEHIGARTLFATHYHELTELENKINGVKNYCISVKEKGEDVIFLRKIIRGGADGSYGIHVAKLAGVPYSVINRAREVLKHLEEADISKKNVKGVTKQSPVTGQVDMFNYKGTQIATELEKLDLDGVRPIDALNILVKLKEKL